MTTNFTIKSMEEFTSQSPVFIDYALKRFKSISRFMSSTKNNHLELSVIYTKRNDEFIVVWHTDLSRKSDMFVSAINDPQLAYVRDVQLSYSTDQQWWLAVPNGRNPDGITLAWINTQRLLID